MTRAVHSRRSWWIGLGLALAGILPHAASAQQTLTSGVEATTVAGAAPAGVAYDAAGNLFVALLNDHVVRKVDTSGIITTVAGTGVQGFSGDGGPATSAMLDSPSGVAIDAAGNLYIADSHNHRVREVVAGTITTIVGTGVAGFAGDGGPATAAQLDLPTALSVDSAGSLYIADTNNQRIRKVVGGVISTVAGAGDQGFAGDGGSAVAALLDSPTGVAADPSNPGQFYIGDTHNHRVRLVNVAGEISTVAGTGAPGFSGDGSAATAAALAVPRGVAVDTSGNVYIADTDNERIREISAGSLNTVAGSGVQGFAGDVGSALSAQLDTPRSVAVNTAGGFGLTDTHNQRVRSVLSANINTVAGIAPALSEGLLLSGPISGVYGAAIGNLTVTFSNGNNTAVGSVSLTDGGVAIATSKLSGNTASFSLNGLSGGVHLLAVTYPGDAQDASIASGLYIVSLARAVQSITFPALPTPVAYVPGVTAALAATASSGLPITYSVTGPATLDGSTLTYTGPGTVVVTATQAGNEDYLPSSVSQTVAVTALLVATSVTPATGVLGAVNLPISVTGSGFTNTSVIKFNGTTLATTFVSATSLSATVPQLTILGANTITVYDSASLQQSSSLTFTVTPPTVSGTLSGPTSSASDEEPSISLQLQTPYPVQIAGTFTLTFTPYGNIGVDDPSIVFSTGGRTLTFIVPPNSTTVPTVALQTGTIAGTITVSLSLIANGVDITPAAARSVAITIPPQVPGSKVSFSQSGSTVTVYVRGFSNVRDMSTATFNFTAAPGTSLSATSLSVPASSDFANWFDSAASDVYGSEFLYTQTFNLSDADAQVQAVSVTLTNSVGASSQATAP